MQGDSLTFSILSFLKVKAGNIDFCVLIGYHGLEQEYRLGGGKQTGRSLGHARRLNGWENDFAVKG